MAVIRCLDHLGQLLEKDERPAYQKTTARCIVAGVPFREEQRMRRSQQWLLALALAAAIVASGAIALGASLKDEVRNPWTRTTSYVRTWLVCGEFPNTSPKGAAPGSSPPRAALATDYLTEHGGEAGIRPAPGMTHRRPDGTAATWTRYTSPQDTLNFLKAFADRPTTDVVAYAYTTISRDQAGPALLALGSDDGVRVWVNGKLAHDHAVRRAVRPDEDIVEARLEAGENAVLVKVEQGIGDWGLCLRVIEEGKRGCWRAAAFPLPWSSPARAGSRCARTARWRDSMRTTLRCAWR